jgi:hypothetical protein
LQNLPIKADSIFNSFGSPYLATQANAIALSNIQKQKFNLNTDPLSFQRLNLYSATLLNNYLVHNIWSLDSAKIKKAYAIASDSMNVDYSEVLKVQIATAWYFKNNVSRALEIMAELAFISDAYKGKYNYLMGLWALEQGNAVTASSYFKYAVMQNYKDAKLYNAIALSEAGLLTEALIAWDSVGNSNDESEEAIANQMKRVLTLSSQEVATLPDGEKYLFCHYRLNAADTILFNGILPSVQDNNYKAQALLDMTKRQFENDNITTSIKYFTQIGGLPLTDQNLYQRIRHFELLMLAERREIENMAVQLNEGIEFSQQQELEKLLYSAIINEASGDTTRAKEGYRVLAAYNPYFVEGTIAAANFFRKQDDKSIRPYNILAEAVQVNDNSIKLWNAYISEAIRMGFDEYAVSAMQRVAEIKVRGTRVEVRSQ